MPSRESRIVSGFSSVGRALVCGTADRLRLIEARTLLEQTYGQDWSVLSLARAVDLNEKRL
ncbi:MAG: hypothetical protein LBI92_04200 [Azoarcus sp.]|nr:hypothetical protein [Azoarcus sp.]